MQLSGKIAIITGAGNGIGRALAHEFHQQKATVVAADIDGAAAESTSREVDGLGLEVDVSNEPEIIRLVQTTLREFGRIDLFCSNAGIMVQGGLEVPNGDWGRIFTVNVMAHVYASRAVLPHMLERGEGYIVQTVSAAGLLSQIGSAPYSVTKHAALAFAEWLAITYGERGIKVSVVCPQGVRTAMLLGSDTGPARFLRDTAITPEQVADAVVNGIGEEKFLILPHPEVGEYFRRKAGDYDRWLHGMRRLQARVLPLNKVEND